ncbi:hypothetical protein AAU61_19235 [Desulfocarbo indianensis]|nr:hypothetical protein AAU61_19235 [Desulfocarbo indianensis]
MDKQDKKSGRFTFFFAERLLSAGTIAIITFLISFYATGGLWPSLIAFASVYVFLLVIYNILDAFEKRGDSEPRQQGEIPDHSKSPISASKYLRDIFSWKNLIINIILIIVMYVFFYIHY